MTSLHLQPFIDKIVEPVFQLLIATILFYLFYRILKVIIKHLFDNYSRIDMTDSARVLTLQRLILSLFQYITVFLYVYTVLAIFGLPVGTLLAGAGIVGVAIGFAGRDLMSDIINGFFIIVEHQVNIGDIVTFKNLDITGTVTVIGIRSLKLTSFDGGVVFIPNRHITALSNLSKLNNSTFLDIPVTQDNVAIMKQNIDLVNQKYPNICFIGIITVDDITYLRNKLSGDYQLISTQKPQIIADYYGIPVENEKPVI